MELFEEAPDDHADWGEIVDMEEKFYKSEDEFMTSSSDSESESEGKIKGILKKSKESKNRKKQVMVRFDIFVSFQLYS